MDEMPRLHPHSLKVKFNPEGSYAINPLTGESVQHIINSLGDTLQTGVKLPVRGQFIDPGNFPKPLVVPSGTPETVPIG